MRQINNILLVTEVFPPAFNPRMGYLTKYLTEMQINVDIITENFVNDNNFKELQGDNRIIRVDITNTDTPTNFLQKLWRLINRKRHFYNNYRPFYKAYTKHFSTNNYDVVLVSVSWQLFVLKAANKIAKLQRCPLIVDLRDIHEQKSVIEYFSLKELGLKNYIFQLFDTSFKKYVISFRNKYIESSNAVISVSDWHIEVLSKINSKSFLIYNGFAPELFKPEPKKSKIFSIIYTGIVLENNESDPTLLFKALRLIVQNERIKPENFRVIFYTPQRFRINVTTNPYYKYISGFVDFKDYVDNKYIPDLLNESSIALVLINKADDNGPKGIMTTKFFEYIGCERPVLLVPNDHGVLEKLITKTNIGCAANNADDVVNFIRQKFTEWEQKGYTTVNVDPELKNKFSRKEQANEFLQIFNNALIEE